MVSYYGEIRVPNEEMAALLDRPRDAEALQLDGGVTCLRVRERS